jgi:hypothetical protein
MSELFEINRELTEKELLKIEIIGLFSRDERSTPQKKPSAWMRAWYDPPRNASM